jgi:hypothetical protein
MQLILVSSLKSQIAKECRQNKEALIAFVDEFIVSGKEIVYKTEDGLVCLNSNVVGFMTKKYKKRFQSKPWLPKLNTIETAAPSRFVFENNQYVDYESSDLYKSFQTNPNFNTKTETPAGPKKVKQKPGISLKKIENLDKSIAREKMLLKQAIDSNKKILSFDVEWYEGSFHKILEIGYSFLNEGEIVSENILIKENLMLLNGNHVPNHKYNFMFGETKVMLLDDAKVYFNNLCDQADFYLGHSLSNDFSSLGMIVDPDKVFDIIRLFNYFNHGATQKMSLERMCSAVKLKTEYLHNAGNDASYSLKFALDSIKHIA